jgi:hypothetical protein
VGTPDLDLRAILENIEFVGHPMEGFIDKSLKTLKPGTVLESLVAMKKLVNYLHIFIGS